MFYDFFPWMYNEFEFLLNLYLCEIVFFENIPQIFTNVMC